jgi:predicted hydrocarbon binding protein
MLPLGIKIKIGLDVFAETFNKFSDQRVRVGEDEENYLWIIERCPVCWERTSTSPACHLAVGLLEESLGWVSRGKRFKVEEISCIATGDKTCTIAISKKPIV